MAKEKIHLLSSMYYIQVICSFLDSNIFWTELLEYPFDVLRL